MTISEVPEQYKVYNLMLSNGKTRQLTGTEKQNVFNSTSNMIQLKNGGGFNKAFIVSWEVDIEETKKNVQEHLEEIKNTLGPAKNINKFIDKKQLNLIEKVL
ncbi:MAG: hypothetical protein WC744_00565 [Patescibacteria group bacterium]|jgi:hypothetical protein